MKQVKILTTDSVRAVFYTHFYWRKLCWSKWNEKQRNVWGVLSGKVVKRIKGERKSVFSSWTEQNKNTLLLIILEGVSEYKYVFIKQKMCPISGHSQGLLFSFDGCALASVFFFNFKYFLLHFYKTFAGFIHFVWKTKLSKIYCMLKYRMRYFFLWKTDFLPLVPFSLSFFSSFYVSYWSMPFSFLPLGWINPVKH